MKVIIITGTPGAGKSTLAKKLAQELKFQRVDLHKYYKVISTGYNKKKQSYDIDIKKFTRLIKEKAKTRNIIVDSHIAQLLPKSMVDLCIALTCSELRKLVKELKTYRAPHTEFVSVYIPADYELTKITQHLAEEQGTASNIKSAETRKNVQGALEKMIQHLRNFPKTPPNGLAVFSGNIAANEGKQDFRVWSVEPPAPLNVRIYRCDKNFVTDILEEIMVDHNVYGLVVLDRRDAILALLKGKTIVPLQKTHSEVPGKFKAGGQCCIPTMLVKINDKNEITISNLDIGEKVVTYDFKNN